MEIKNVQIKLLLCLALMCKMTISCDDVIFEEDISEYAVSVLAPTNYTSINEGTIGFNWEKVSGADQYRIQVATPNFINADKIVLDSATSLLQIAKQLPSGEYEWRIRAENSAFETKYFNQYLTVTEVVDFDKQEVILTSPVQNLVTNQNLQELSWQDVPESKEYRVQIWQPDINGTLMEDRIVQSTTTEYDFEDNNYWWQVRAQTETQNTLYYGRKLLVDTEVPNTPSLQTPENEEILPDEKVDFSWQRETITGSTEVDSIYVYKDENLTELIFKDKSTNMTYTKNMDMGAYFWLVQSFDQAGNKSVLSTTFSFSTP